MYWNNIWWYLATGSDIKERSSNSCSAKSRRVRVWRIESEQFGDGDSTSSSSIAVDWRRRVRATWRRGGESSWRLASARLTERSPVGVCNGLERPVREVVDWSRGSQKVELSRAREGRKPATDKLLSFGGELSFSSYGSAGTAEVRFFETRVARGVTPRRVQSDADILEHEGILCDLRWEDDCFLGVLLGIAASWSMGAK